MLSLEKRGSDEKRKAKRRKRSKASASPIHLTNDSGIERALNRNSSQSELPHSPEIMKNRFEDFNKQKG